MTMLGQKINGLDDITVELINIGHTVTIMWNDRNTCIVCTSPPLSAAGVEPPTKFLKTGRGGLDRTSVFRGGCWERGGDFFQVGLQFLTKNKLQSGMFNDKKSL